MHSMDDLNAFDVLNKSWKVRIGYSNDPISLRHGHSTCLFNDKLVVAFGKDINY